MRKARILYGNYAKEGLQLSSHTSSDSLTEFLPEGALHIVLNTEGSAILFGEDLRVNLSPGTMVVFHRSEGEILTANRTNEANNFVILSVTNSWVRQTFGARQSALHPVLQSVLSNSPGSSAVLGKVRSMSLAEKEIAQELQNPPVAKAAKTYWYMAKVLEVLTHHLFAPASFTQSEPFCSKMKRNDRDRVERCISWLKERLDQPLNLTTLAQHIGCAPHYLSRQFKKSTGLTLKQKHRALRIDYAAKLLDDGDYNVTESAMEVGYSSLSHFSKAFLKEKGCLPSEYLSD